MCKGCYIEYGEPDKRSDLTSTAIVLISKVYDEDAVAGACHIVLDDWNIEDDWVDEILKKPNLTDTERKCMMTMRKMDLDERATALALYDRFIPMT